MKKLIIISTILLTSLPVLAGQVYRLPPDNKEEPCMTTTIGRFCADRDGVIYSETLHENCQTIGGTYYDGNRYCYVILDNGERSPIIGRN